MRMGLGAMFERLKQHIYSKPSNSVSNSQSISENFTSYEPTLFFNMGCGDEESYVDVEYISVQQFVRVSGVNFNMHCIDFLVRLCCYLGLRPGDYTFLVPSESLSGVSPICWRCVPPSSKLGSWVNSNTTLTKFPPMVRLIAKCCLKRSAKLYQYPFLDTEFKHPIIPTKTGREFLADLGYRIIVHLPENRKIVVRGQLDQPIMNVLQEVSSERHLQLSDYCIINPKTGTILDPLDTFTNQHADQIELKELNYAKLDQNFPKVTGNSKATSSTVSLPGTVSTDHYSEQDKQSFTMSSDASNEYAKSNIQPNNNKTIKRKHKKRPAPGIPTKHLLIDEHISPFSFEPDKVKMPSTFPRKKSVTKIGKNKRNSIVDAKSSSRTATRKSQSQELIIKSSANTSFKRSSTQKCKSSTPTPVKSNSKKQSTTLGSSYRPPTPPSLPSDFLKSVNGNQSNPLDKKCHKSELDLSKAPKWDQEKNVGKPELKKSTSHPRLCNSSSSLTSPHAFSSPSDMTNGNVCTKNQMSANAKTLINYRKKASLPGEPSSAYSRSASLVYPNSVTTPNMDIITELSNAFQCLKRFSHTDDNTDCPKPVAVQEVCKVLRQNSQDMTTLADNKQKINYPVESEVTYVSAEEKWNKWHPKKSVSTTFWSRNS